MRLSRRNAILAAAGVLALVVLALYRGPGPSEQQQALRDDPMAAYVPPAGRLVDTRSQNEGTTLGKPVAATYARLFALPPGEADRALEHAASAATAAGWVPLPRSRAFPDVFSADRRVPTGRISLAVTLLRDPRVLPDGVRGPALLISLRHAGG